MGAPPPDVKAYLEALPADQRKALLDLRATILSVVPKATERLSYRIPSFFLGRGLVSMAAFTDHCSFFAGHEGARMGRDDGRVAVKASTIHFTPEKPLPKDFVRSVVRMRLKMNAELDKAKAAAKAKPARKARR